jgi:hypothetical protein
MEKEYEQIEKYYIEKGKQISKILQSTYDSAEFEIESNRIEAEIYDIATSYAKVYFFEAQTFLSDENRVKARAQVRSRFDFAFNKIEKMKDTELVAHMIKSEVIKELEDVGIHL